MRYSIAASFLAALVSAQANYPVCDPPMNELAPAWTLDGIHYSTTETQADISFKLSSNFRKGVTASCKASSTAAPTFFTFDESFGCDMSENALRTDSASFRYNSETGEVEISQTWTCVVGESTVTRFTAKGSKAAELECENTTPEEEECTAGSLSFEASEITAVA